MLPWERLEPPAPEEPERGEMRSLPVSLFVAVFSLCGWGVLPGNGQVRETAEGIPIRVALDLMDLDIPGEGGGDEMELPPIQGAERPEKEGVPAESARQPAEGERSRSGVEEARRPKEAPAPGVVPFLLEEPGARQGTTRAGSVTTAEPAAGEGLEDVPVLLKAVPPPPSHTDGLRLDSGTETRKGGPSQVPEIPLLKGEDGGQRQAEPSLQDPSLTMKPLPDPPGVSEAHRPAAGPSQRSRRPEDTLQVREDIDARLLEIFERYYKDR